MADPTFGTVAGLITNLGAAGAIAWCVYAFLNFLRDQGQMREAQETRRDQAFEAMCSRLGKQLEENTVAMRQFSQSVVGICRATDHSPKRQS